MRKKTIDQLSAGIDIPTNYGKMEWLYGNPFAQASLVHLEFRNWILDRTPYSQFARDSVILADSMYKLRTPGTQFWWRSYVCAKCNCSACLNGKETDMLLILENSRGIRFAIHIEIKHPWDEFKCPDQAKDYGKRARCWQKNAELLDSHKRILAHHHTSTMLLCCEDQVERYGSNCDHFDSVVTYQDIKKNFPHIYSNEMVPISST